MIQKSIPVLQSLDDYSAYMSPDSFKEMETETSGKFGGLGIEVGMEFGVVKVITPMDNSPAEREGVKAGKEPLGLTVSNLLTMGFAGFIFGPALVGYSAEYFGLTFNMLALCLIWFLNSCLLIYIKK